jgi:hypothetical protein
VGQSSAPANLNAPYAEHQPPANLRKPLTSLNPMEKQSALLERF